MKIITEGKTPEEKFVGTKSTCGNCKTVVEFGEEDAKLVRYNDDQRDGGYYLEWRCPHCQRTNTAYGGGSASSYYDR